MRSDSMSLVLSSGSLCFISLQIKICLKFVLKCHFSPNSIFGLFETQLAWNSIWKSPASASYASNSIFFIATKSPKIKGKPVKMDIAPDPINPTLWLLCSLLTWKGAEGPRLLNFGWRWLLGCWGATQPEGTDTWPSQVVSVGCASGLSSPSGSQTALGPSFSLPSETLPGSICPPSPSPVVWSS